MKKYYFLIIVVLIFGLVLTGCSLLSNISQVPATDQSGINYLTKGTETDPEPFPLYAGQDWLVGEVLVWDDGEYLCVRYELSEDALNDGWLIYETHLAVADDLSDIPTNKSGNPVPGKFPYGDDELGGVPSYEECDIPIPVDCDVSFVIAAHAVIEKTECEVLAEAPYGGSRVVDSDQGLRYDYTAVRLQRSNPAAALTFTTGKNEANFFSLGFQEDRVDHPGDDAWIIIEFDYQILNGPGDDLRVIEDTWGLPYPKEFADVWVSQNGTDWEYLGMADNQNPYMDIHTITDFDLDAVGLGSVSFVKVQDRSIRSDFDDKYPAQKDTLDGYDLNAVVALHDHEVCEKFDQSAWGAVSEGEIRFVSKGNWATYFNYTIKCPEPQNILIVSQMNPSCTVNDCPDEEEQMTVTSYLNNLGYDYDTMWEYEGTPLVLDDFLGYDAVIYLSWSYPVGWANLSTVNTLIKYFNDGGNLIVVGDDISRAGKGSGHPYQPQDSTNGYAWEAITRLGYINNGGSTEVGITDGYLITLGTGHPVLYDIEGETFNYYNDCDTTNFLSETGATELATSSRNSTEPYSDLSGGTAMTAFDNGSGGKIVAIDVNFYGGYYHPDSNQVDGPAIPEYIAETLLDNAIKWVCY